MAAKQLFPARLRAQRERAGLTQAELASACGWTAARVSALERDGGYQPRRETTAALSAALACRPEDLDPSWTIEIPDGVVVLRPDPDVAGAYRAWRDEDRRQVPELIGHDELGALSRLLRAHGLGLCLLP